MYWFLAGGVLGLLIAEFTGRVWGHLIPKTPGYSGPTTEAALIIIVNVLVWGGMFWIAGWLIERLFAAT